MPENQFGNFGQVFIIILQVLYLFFIAFLAPLELGFFCFNGRVVVCSNLETGVLVRTQGKSESGPLATTVETHQGKCPCNSDVMSRQRWLCSTRLSLSIALQLVPGKSTGKIISQSKLSFNSKKCSWVSIGQKRSNTLTSELQGHFP